MLSGEWMVQKTQIQTLRNVEENESFVNFILLTDQADHRLGSRAVHATMATYTRFSLGLKRS